MAAAAVDSPLALPDDLWARVASCLPVHDRICLGASSRALRPVSRAFVCGDHAQAARKAAACAQICELRAEWASQCFGRVVIDGHPMRCVSLRPDRFALRRLRMQRAAACA